VPPDVLHQVGELPDREGVPEPGKVQFCKQYDVRGPELAFKLFKDEYGEGGGDYPSARAVFDEAATRCWTAELVGSALSPSSVLSSPPSSRAR
jgi:hypothetical protein